MYGTINHVNHAIYIANQNHGGIRTLKNKFKKASLLTVSALIGASALGASVAMVPAFAKSRVAHRDTSVVKLQETGSTLLFPLFQLWVPAYKKVAPNVQITPSGTGSGTGIQQASDGTVQIGASDAYMSTAQLQTTPGILNIPLAISAQQVMYHIPGVSKKVHLKLTGNILAQIYTGKIRYWNDPQIVKLNKGVKLPHNAIVPIHRQDASGDTFLFTQFLTDTNANWSRTVQYGTSVSWPSVPGALGAQGNQGVVQTAVNTPNSVAYVGISWLDQGLQHGLGEALLQNKAGQFLLPNTTTIKSAASAMIGKTPKDERISLIYAPGKNSYPIINYEYAIVNQKQANVATANAVKKLLDWAISPSGGNKAVFMQKVHFLPLPASIQPLSKTQINKIHG